MCILGFICGAVVKVLYRRSNHQFNTIVTQVTDAPSLYSLTVALEEH